MNISQNADIRSISIPLVAGGLHVLWLRLGIGHPVAYGSSVPYLCHIVCYICILVQDTPACCVVAWRGLSRLCLGSVIHHTVQLLLGLLGCKCNERSGKSAVGWNGGRCKVSSLTSVRSGSFLKQVYIHKSLPKVGDLFNPLDPLS